MKAMQVVVAGAHGRMGQEIRTILAAETKKYKFVAGVDRTAKDGVKKSFAQITAKTVDVVIDFSGPDLFLEALAWCEKNKVPFVSGTTGLDKEHFGKLEAAAKKIPVYWAPNMSEGVAWVLKALALFDELKDDFDFQIEEIHHKHKKDQPSGTAKIIEQKLKEQVGAKLKPTLSLRGGGVFGIHRIYALSEHETITLEHTALDRQVFAYGSLKAAAKLVNAKPGRYGVRA